MRESFTYLFKDNKWIVKAFTAFIFIKIIDNTHSINI